MGYMPGALCEPCLAPVKQTNWKNTFLNNQEYLNTKWVLEDVKKLLFILLGLIMVF